MSHRSNFRLLIEDFRLRTNLTLKSSIRTQTFFSVIYSINFSFLSTMKIHLGYNPKGGVGKSFFLRTLLQYLIDNEYPFITFDTDRNNPDVYRCYKSVIPVKLAIFSEATKYEDAANGIFNCALQNTTLVNLPAQVYEPLKKWIFDNELLEIGRDTGVRFHFWHVTDAGYDSLQLLKKTVQLYREDVDYTVVKNYGRATDFDALAADLELQELLEQYNARTISLPCFIGSSLRNTIDAESLSFGEALNYEGFGVIDKQRIRKFLRESYREIDTILKNPVLSS